MDYSNHLQFNLGVPECLTRGHWDKNDKGEPWFIYNDINERPAVSAYIARLSKDVSMPTIAFEDWFIKHKDQIYDDGLWDQLRKYHKTDRSKLECITLPAKWDAHMEAFVDVYGV